MFTYLVLVFLILRFSVTLFNFLSNPKLGHYGKRFDDKVSIIICSSYANNKKVLESIIAQDYKNIEAIIADPTEHLSAVAADAYGRYLLFVDSDSVIHNGLLNSLIYRMKVYNLKSIRLIPGRQLFGFKDLLIQPITDFVILNLLPLRLVRMLSLPSLGSVNENYVFYDAASYINAHGNLKDQGDDERKVETLLANGMIVNNRKVSTNEISKELLQIFDGNILAVSLYLLLLIGGPVVLVWNFELAFIALPFGLIFLTRIMISFLTKQNPLFNVILHPLQMVVLMCLLLGGYLKKMRIFAR